MDTKEFMEMVRTKGRVIAELYRYRTPLVDACKKIQVTEKKTSTRKGDPEPKTEIIDKLCDRAKDEFCGACPFPDKKWKHDLCNLATHLHIETKKGQTPSIVTPITMKAKKSVEEQKLNPIKQSKRGL